MRIDNTMITHMPHDRCGGKTHVRADEPWSYLKTPKA